MQYIALLAAACLAGIDQLTKWLVVSNLEKYEAVPLIGDGKVLNFYYCTNNGSAFSMMGGKTVLLITVTSVVIIGLVLALVLKKIKRVPYVCASALIIGGGLGNLIDRLFNDGLVVDFIDVRLINFPIFNFADICAVCGGILMCVMVVTDEVKEAREKKARGASVENKSSDIEEARADSADDNGGA